MSDRDREHDHRPRCSGRTANGQRCSRDALEGGTRCAQHSFRVPGRPTKLTPALSEQIVHTVLEGNYLAVAAQAAGIGRRTLYRWLEKADDLEAAALEHLDDDATEAEVYDHTDPRDWVYLDFRHALKSAEAFAETELVRMARSGGMGWQAWMTLLERRHPQRWKRREVHEHEGEVAVRRKDELHEPEGAKRQRTAAILEAANVPALVAAKAENTTTTGGKRAKKQPAKPRRSKR